MSAGEVARGRPVVVLPCGVAGSGKTTCAQLDDRAKRFHANAAFPITQNTLAAYLAGFEEPHGEGEDVFPFRERS